MKPIESYKESYEEAFGIVGHSINSDSTTKLLVKAEIILTSALTTRDDEWRTLIEDVMKHGEQVYGFQPHVPDHILSDAMQEKIYFDGFKNGRALMRIDLSTLLEKSK